jgi:Skp family chaperone for outer membrane proteins
MKKRLLIACSCVLLALGASAVDQKIATIDLRKVFDNYWRTKQADVKLKEDAGELEKDRKIMVDQFQKNEEKYAKLLDSIKDPALAPAERDKRKKDAEGELLGLREMENRIKQFDATSRAQLGEKQRRIRDNILSEIKETIKAKVRTEGYTLVFDTAAETPNGTPILLYTSGNDDITEIVLKELNINAPPPSAAKTPEKAPDKAPAK